MFVKEKAKGSPRQGYSLWLFFGLCIGTIGVVAVFFGLFEPRRDMHFNETATIIHDDYVHFSTYSPDNQRIFSHSTSNGLRVSDIEGHHVALFQELSASYEISWNPSQSYFLATNHQQSVTLFDSTGNRITDYQHPGVYYTNWSSTGSRIMSMSETELRLWAIDGQLLNSLPQPIGYTDAIQWSPDASRLVMWWNENEAGLYDEDGNLLRTLEISGYASSYAWNSTSTAFIMSQHIPDEIAKQAINVYDREGILLWSEEMQVEALDLLWSPDSSRLAILKVYEGKAAIWSIEGEQLAEIDYGSIFHWHPDGEFLIAGTPEGRDLRYLDKNGELLHVLPHSGETSFIYPQWSPDGEIMAVWTNQLQEGYASLYLWDKQGNLLHEFRESSPIQFVYWAPDSNRILSVGGFVARLWSVSDGGEINSLQHSQTIVHAKWSSDGSRIVTVGSYGSMLLENAVWTGEGEHLATLFTGDSFQTMVYDWRDDLGQALILHGSRIVIYNLEPGSVYFDFRFAEQ